MLSAVVSLCAGLSMMAAPAPAAKAPTPKSSICMRSSDTWLPDQCRTDQNGLEPLLIDQNLVVSARKRTAWMTSNNACSTAVAWRKTSPWANAVAEKS